MDPRLPWAAVALTIAAIFWLYRRYCERAVSEFLGLLDGWDAEIADAKAYAAAAVRRARIAPDFPLEVDVVCSGGGFKVLYAAGALYFLKKYGIKEDALPAAEKLKCLELFPQRSKLQSRLSSIGKWKCWPNKRLS